MFANVDLRIANNVLPLPGIPKICFICVATTVIAIAFVNPDVTGADTKSIRNPNPKIPDSNSMDPDRNANRTDLCQLPPAACKTMIDPGDVAPNGMSLHDPKITYTKGPKKEE